MWSRRSTGDGDRVGVEHPHEVRDDPGRAGTLAPGTKFDPVMVTSTVVPRCRVDGVTVETTGRTRTRSSCRRPAHRPGWSRWPSSARSWSVTCGLTTASSWVELMYDVESTFAPAIATLAPGWKLVPLTMTSRCLAPRPMNDGPVGVASVALVTVARGVTTRQPVQVDDTVRPGDGDVNGPQRGRPGHVDLHRDRAGVDDHQRARDRGAWTC